MRCQIMPATPRRVASRPDNLDGDKNLFQCQDKKTTKYIDLDDDKNLSMDRQVYVDRSSNNDAYLSVIVLESLSFDILVVEHETEDTVGSDVQGVKKVVLVKSGWSAMRQVSFKITISPWGDSAKLYKAVQSLPHKYLCRILTLESVAFNFSVAFDMCILMSPRYKKIVLFLYFHLLFPAMSRL